MEKFTNLQNKITHSLMIMLFLVSQAAQSDVFQVTREDDPFPDGCQIIDCSLREAVMAANLNPGDDEILLSEGSYEIEIPADDNNENETGDFDVTTDLLTITGQGHWSTSINGNYLDRIFDVVDAELKLENILIFHGDAGNENGGGVRVIDGSITVDGVTMEGCKHELVVVFHCLT